MPLTGYKGSVVGQLLRLLFVDSTLKQAFVLVVLRFVLELVNKDLA